MEDKVTADIQPIKDLFKKKDYREPYQLIQKKTQHNYMYVDVENEEYKITEGDINLTGVEGSIWNASPRKTTIQIEKKTKGGKVQKVNVNVDGNRSYIKSQLDCIYILLDYTSLKDDDSKSVIEVRKENLYQAIQSLYYSDRTYKKNFLKRLADFQIFSRLYRLNYYTGKPTDPVNLLKETYNIHFKQLSEYINGKLKTNQKIHFEFMMVQYFSFSPDRVQPCLVITRKDNKDDTQDRIEIDYPKLGEIGTITKIINVLEKLKAVVK